LDNNKHDVLSFELWHNDLSWKIFDVVLVDEQIKDIIVKSGVGRGMMIEGYKRVE
jgi:hypothetical protein